MTTASQSPPSPQHVARVAEGLGLIVTWAQTHTHRRANIATAVRSTLLMRNITAWFAASTPAYEAMIAFNPGNGAEPDVEKLPAVLAMMHVAVNVAGLPKWDDARDHAKVVYNQLVTMFKQARDKTVRAKLQEFVEKETIRLADEVVIQFKRHEGNRPSTEAWRPTLPKGEWNLLQAMLGLTATGCRDLMLKNPDTVYCVIDSLSEMWKDSAGESDEDEVSVPTDVDIAALTARVEAAETRVKEAMATASGAEQISEAAETGVAAMTKRFAALEKRAAAAERRAAEADSRAEEADEKIKAMKATIDDFRQALKAVVVDMTDLRHTTSSAVVAPPPPPPATPTTPPPPPEPPRARVSNDIIKRITAMEHQVSWIIPQIHMQFCTSWNAAHSQWHLMNATGSPHVPMPSLQ